MSSVLYFSSDREERQWYALEYWLANGAYFVVSMLTADYTSPLVALPSVVWIWRVRTVRNILKSVTRTDVNKKWHMPFLVSAYALSGTLALLDFPFAAYTLPQAIAGFIVLMDCLIRGRNNLMKVENTAIHKFLYLSIFIIAAHMLDYPFLRFEPVLAPIGYGIVLMTNIMMAIILPAVTIYEMKQEQQRKLEEVLREQAKLSALGEMTKGIAHEMNNPLGVILLRAHHIRNQVMNDSFEKDALVRNLDHIEATSEKMTKIIRSLRNFTNSSKNEKFMKVKLKEIINDTISYCENRFRLHAIVLIVDDIPETEIECNPDEISQVVLNLLNNSFDAVVNLEERWIRISFLKKSQSIVIQVVDSGPGIPLHIRRKMMDPFFTTKTTPGTGLGLSISMGIVEKHQGKLFYEDLSGRTSMKVELPLDQTTRYSQSS